MDLNREQAARRSIRYHHTLPMNDPNKRPDNPNSNPSSEGNSTPSSEGNGPTAPTKPVDHDRDALDSYLNSIFEGREDYVPKSRRREDGSAGKGSE